jgi:hypothetical protein
VEDLEPTAAIETTLPFPPDSASAEPALAAALPKSIDADDGATRVDAGDASLRERLGVALIGRLGIACVFLAAVLASRIFGLEDAFFEDTPTITGASAAVALALLSVGLGRRVRRLVPFAMAQVLLDVILLTGAIAAVWSGVPGPAGQGVPRPQRRRRDGLHGCGAARGRPGAPLLLPSMLSCRSRSRRSCTNVIHL